MTVENSGAPDSGSRFQADAPNFRIGKQANDDLGFRLRMAADVGAGAPSVAQAGAEPAPERAAQTAPAVQAAAPEALMTDPAAERKRELFNQLMAEAAQAEKGGDLVAAQLAFMRAADLAPTGVERVACRMVSII